MNLGKAIRLCREQRSLSLVTLSDRAGISPSYLSLLERGKRDPNFSTVEKIASAIGIPMSVLLFVASDKREFESFSPELAEKLSLVALRLMEAPGNDRTSPDLFS